MLNAAIFTEIDSRIDLHACVTKIRIFNDLHQLLAVLPRNSDVSEFHRNILNPSHPERSSGLIANWYPAGPDFVSLAAGLPSAPPFAIICGWVVAGYSRYCNKYHFSSS